MRKYIIGVLALAGVTLTAGTSAHHSFAVHFDGDRVITVEGVITSFRFANPHGEVEWTTTNENGETEQWRAETNSPNMLKRRGWSRGSLQPGDEVSVTGFPAREDSHYMRVNRIDFEDGREPLIGQGASSQD